MHARFKTRGQIVVILDKSANQPRRQIRHHIECFGVFWHATLGEKAQLGHETQETCHVVAVKGIVALDVSK